MSHGNRAEIKEALEGLQAPQEKERHEHFKTILSISERTPEKLYPFWDFFVDELRRPEVTHKFIGIHILANLVITTYCTDFYHTQEFAELV